MRSEKKHVLKLLLVCWFPIITLGASISNIDQQHDEYSSELNSYLKMDSNEHEKIKSLHSVSKPSNFKRGSQMYTSKTYFGIRPFHDPGINTGQQPAHHSDSVLRADGKKLRIKASPYLNKLDINSMDNQYTNVEGYERGHQIEIMPFHENTDIADMDTKRMITEQLQSYVMSNQRNTENDHSSNSMYLDYTATENSVDTNIYPTQSQYEYSEYDGTSNLQATIDQSSSKPDESPEGSVEATFEGSGEISGSDALKNTAGALKLGRIITIFPRGNNTPECTTPKGESGRCLGLTQCFLAESLNNYGIFLQYMCLRGIGVGICCPGNPVIETSDSLSENSTENTTLEFKLPPNGCGLASNTRIVGGKVSLPHEWTWMVALMRRNRFYCGGVIINDWYILTAAHCVMSIKVKDLKVRLGEYNFLEKNDHQQDIPVSHIKRHALFVTLTFQHDIALLKLKHSIKYSKVISTICLPKEGDFSQVNATVVGWGTVSFGGAASPVLRQVTVPVWNNEDCDRTYILEKISDSFMCAGSPENGEDACQGDSGGPLMALNENGRWEVIGIVSWGRRCGDPSYPGVYTRVTSYLDWIAENAQ